MKTADEMYQYCRENNFGQGMSRMWDKKHFKIIESSLHDDEKVIMTFMGMHNYISTTRHDNYYAYAITTKRIMMAQKKMVGENFKSVLLTYLNDISFNSGVMFGTLTIDTIKEKFNVGIDKKQAKNISEKVSSFIFDMKKESGKEIESNKSQKSVVDELQGLKQLLDSGALTQDEFDLQKKKILDN